MGDQKIEKYIDFKKLADCTGSLFYNSKLQTFQLGSVVFEVEEDPDDGYRSCLGVIKVIQEDAPRILGNLLGRVKIKVIDSNDHVGYELVDIDDNHLWLQFGTDHSDSYYPYFYYNFFPKNLKL